MTPSDFRPISLLPCLSKIIEKLVNIQIVAYITKHSFLDPNQSAYKKNHSTQTALLKLCEDIYDVIDDSEISLLVLLDFSKAFDTVNHELLLAKLDILGFEKNTKRVDSLIFIRKVTNGNNKHIKFKLVSHH